MSLIAVGGQSGGRVGVMCPGYLQCLERPLLIPRQTPRSNLAASTSRCPHGDLQDS